MHQNKMLRAQIMKEALDIRVINYKLSLVAYL